MPSPRPRARAQKRPPPEPQSLDRAFERLEKHRALQTLVRGGLPQSVLKRLLKDALPKSAAREMPPEVWPSLALGIAYDSFEFQDALGQALNDELGWDREPSGPDEWWQVVRERPLQALWLAALSEDKAVRKEFAHVVEHCLENYRSSPECLPPSWAYVEGLLAVEARSAQELRDAEKRAEDAERRAEADRARLEELREELKRLRRETSELRAETAAGRRRIEELQAAAEAPASSAARERAEELERRLRKADKEREHLSRELERRLTLDGQPPGAAAPEAAEPPLGAQPPAPEAAQARPISEDPNPRRRVLRQILRKLFKKGKIGASHTHEDNVYRGVADHEKGIAKEAIDVLYREGYLLPKPTVTDPHVSIAPERAAEVKAIVAGELGNPRLQRFVES